MDLSAYQQFIALSRYARYLPDQYRRETWEETVSRYCNFISENYPYFPKQRMYESIVKMDVMPSMRAMMTAGAAMARDHVAGYNCSYVAIDDVRCFDEAMYILMCGCGLGFSVERQFIAKLPEISEEFHISNTVIHVEDSRIGWAQALRELISLLYAGHIPSWDLSSLRPAGAPLKVFGGRSSGPLPLDEMFKFCVDIFKRAAGRKLNSRECHDIMCKIGDVVVVGGVRRCLPGDAPLFTPTGVKAIRDITPGDKIITGGQIGTVVAAGSSGEKQTIIIKHRFGQLECTPEHRVAVYNSIMKYEFKAASEIIEGDRLVWDNVGYDGIATTLPLLNEELHFNASDVSIPELTPDVAWLFGLFHGDGYVGERSLEIAGNMRELGFLGRAAAVLQQHFGVSAEYGSDGRSGVGARLRAHSKPLVRWFTQHIKRANTPIRVPAFIMDGTRDIRFAYLAGLMDADGRIRTDGRIDQACTIYREFADDLITLLAGLGIGTYLANGNGERRRAVGVNAKDFWTISIVGNVNRKVFCDGCEGQSLKLVGHDLTFDGPIDFSFPIRWSSSNQGYSPMGNINVTGMRYDLPLLPTRVMSIEKGRQIDTYDIQVDIECFTTRGIVVHNSALISLSNLSDQRMAVAKSGQWWETEPQRALANNSVAYTEKPEIGLFMKEWLNLYDSKSGERGIFNREGAVKKARETGRRDFSFQFGTNPCQPAFAPVLTQQGISTIGAIKEDDAIWSEDGWVRVVKKWSTGVKPVYRYRTTAGVFYGTAEHRVVEAGVKVPVQEAEGIDILSGPVRAIAWRQPEAVMDGLIIGDGSVHALSAVPVYLTIGKNDQDYFDSEIKHLILGTHAVRHANAYKTETTIQPHELETLPQRVIPRRYVEADVDTMASFLRGLYSANGSVVVAGKVFRITLKTTSSVLVEQVQVMLSALGLPSFVTTNKPANVAWANGTYLSRTSYDVNITGCFGGYFASVIGFLQNYKNEKLQQAIAASGPRTKPLKVCYEIRDVELIGEMEVFDICVSGDHHTYWSGCHNVSNCAEIILRPNQFCNLSEVVIREDDTPDTLREKVEVATILGTFQSCFTDFRYLRSVWKKNMDEERLLGVSLTGIMDNKFMSGRQGLEQLASVLCDLRQVAIQVNQEWADKLGIPRSAAITTVKPSGTVSQLTDAASGIHPRFDYWYIRTVRNDKRDPLSDFLISEGVPHETDVTKDSNWVFSFPMKSPGNSRIASKMSAIDQLEHYVVYTKNWAEHSCSITVYVREHEWLDVAAWVYKNFDDLNGVSFLPYSEHIYKQAPYQSITEQQYEELLAAFPSVDYNNYQVNEYDDYTTGSKMLACTAGVCEI